MGCIRESNENWLQIEVPPEIEISLKPIGLYRLNMRGHVSLHKQFDFNQVYGQISALYKQSPWDLQVFIVYRGIKAQPEVDM